MPLVLQVLSNTTTGDAQNQTVTTVVLQVPITLTPGEPAAAAAAAVAAELTEGACAPGLCGAAGSGWPHLLLESRRVVRCSLCYPSLWSLSPAAGALLRPPCLPAEVSAALESLLQLGQPPKQGP